MTTYIKKYYDGIPTKFVLYFIKIKDKHIYKFGRTNKLMKRLSNLRVSIYEDIELYSVIPCCCRQSSINKEKYIKDEIEPFIIRGEWFRLSDNSLLDMKIEKLNMF